MENNVILGQSEKQGQNGVNQVKGDKDINRDGAKDSIYQYII